MLPASLACAAIGLVLAACDDGPHGSIATPDAGPSDAGETPPGLIVLVSPEGNDAHDGIRLPVETLKRGIAIATANRDVSDIVLAAGRYTMRQGEGFPYKLPPNVVGISGAPGGGSVLVGNGGDAGLMLASGKLQDLAFESFTTAIDATGTVRIKNLRIAASRTGIHAADGAKLRIDDLQITGNGGSPICATGLELDGIADVTLTGFTTSDVSPAVEVASHSSQKISVVDIANAMMTLSPETTCARSLLTVASTTLSLTDSTIDGGRDMRPRGDGPHGIVMVTAPQLKPALTLTRTTLRHLHFGMQITGAVARIEHSELTDNITGFQGDAGSWTLEDVTIARNFLGFALGGDSVNGSTTLAMHHSRILNNSGGGIILLEGVAGADLGTSPFPGFNTFTSNFPVALDIRGTPSATPVSAVFNTWTPGVQGANDAGQFPIRQTIPGPVASSFGNNYALAAGWSLQL